MAKTFIFFLQFDQADFIVIIIQSLNLQVKITEFENEGFKNNGDYIIFYKGKNVNNELIFSLIFLENLQKNI